MTAYLIERYNKLQNIKYHTFILIHMQKNMAAALTINQAMPAPKSANCFNPEKRMHKRMVKPRKIQAMRIRL